VSGSDLVSRVRLHRERLGLSQQALADLVGVSRQAIVGIEGGRQVPSTMLGLRLSRALRCTVEDLFLLPAAADGLRVALVRGGAVAPRAEEGRVAVGEVRGRWVAHPLPAEGTDAADALVRSSRGDGGVIDPLVDPSVLSGNVLVTGCAPVLGMLARRVESRFAGARATWLPGGSVRSLDLLAEGLVHVGGVHLSGRGEAADHEALIRARFPDEAMLIVNLARWREGFVVAAGNPLGIHDADGLLRPGLRFARREVGAGARSLVEALLVGAGAPDAMLAGPEASGHVEVARLVRCGAADVGVAIESVALTAGLGFVPLVEERFDLVVPASVAEAAPVSRFLDALDDPSFRAEMAHVPGYDTSLSGHVTTLEAA